MSESASKIVGVPMVSKKRLVVAIGVLGFASGLPNVLLNDTLSAWLADINVPASSIGLLAFATLPYGLKLLWAPLLDCYRAPGFAFLGLRRSWIALLCTLLVVAILSATLDAAVDAHRTDAASGVIEGPAASAFVIGYRVAFVSIGALILMLVPTVAEIFGDASDPLAREMAWRILIGCGGAAMLIGVLAAFLAPEPPRRAPVRGLNEAMIEPVQSFIRAFGSRFLLVILVALMFRLPDLLGNRMTMPFLKQEIGFTVEDIGLIRQAGGFAMTIFGALIGGFCVLRFGLFRSLLVFGALQVASNAGYIVLAQTGKSMPTFVGVIATESFCNGLVSAAFVAYFMELCEPKFAAAQYAILSGLMYLAGAVVGGVSGFLVEQVGYEWFFGISILVGLPPLALLPWAMPTRNATAPPMTT